jgi:hypothetical protein
VPARCSLSFRCLVPSSLRGGPWLLRVRTARRRKAVAFVRQPRRAGRHALRSIALLVRSACKAPRPRPRSCPRPRGRARTISGRAANVPDSRTPQQGCTGPNLADTRSGTSEAPARGIDVCLSPLRSRFPRGQRTLPSQPRRLAERVETPCDTHLGPRGCRLVGRGRRAPHGSRGQDTSKEMKTQLAALNLPTLRAHVRVRHRWQAPVQGRPPPRFQRRVHAAIRLSNRFGTRVYSASIARARTSAPPRLRFAVGRPVRIAGRAEIPRCRAALTRRALGWSSSRRPNWHPVRASSRCRLCGRSKVRARHAGSPFHRASSRSP